MKILFINPPCRYPSMIPLGIGYIASLLRDDGHKINILDINAHQYSESEVETKIKELDYDCVGIGGLTTTYKYVKWLSNLIKRYQPGVPIIAGNMVATAHPRPLLEKTKVDIAVIDEGEITCEELFSTLASKNDFRGIKGIWYKSDGKIYQNPNRERIKDLDKLPFPAWDLFPMKIYLRNPIQNEFGLRSINVSAVRGCPYCCNYCSRPFGQRVYARSANNIIEEIKELKQRYGVEYIAFSGDHFIISKKWVFELCNRLASERLNIKWGATGRANLIDKEILKAMKKAGCVLLGYGFESGSQQILDNMNKRSTIEQAEKSIKLTRQAGIYVLSSFMFGMIGETKETIKETVDFIKRMRIPNCRLFFTTPYPGTQLYELAREMGRLPTDEDKYLESLGEMHTTYLVNLTNFSDDELVRLKKEAEKAIQKNFSLKIHLERFWMELRRRRAVVKFQYRDEGLLSTIRMIFSKLKTKLFKKQRK